MIKRIYIEITNQCNLSCSFCAKNRREARFMSTEGFEHILKQTAKITKYIYLHVQGEPLLHPELNRFMEFADSYGCQVQLVTNGVLLKNHMDLLSAPALRKLSISLQSIEAHTMPVESYMEPVFRFIEHASKQSRPYCELRFWRDDLMSAERTEECLRLIQSRYTASESGRIRNEKILPGVYVDYSNPFEWPSRTAQSCADHGTCLGGISQIAILSDGTVVPCCLDENGEIALGNIFEEALETSLKSQRYLNLTEGFRRHRLIEPLCQKCTFRHRFD